MENPALKTLLFQLLNCDPANELLLPASHYISHSTPRRIHLTIAFTALEQFKRRPSPSAFENLQTFTTFLKISASRRLQLLQQAQPFDHLNPIPTLSALVPDVLPSINNLPSLDVSLFLTPTNSPLPNNDHQIPMSTSNSVPTRHYTNHHPSFSIFPLIRRQTTSQQIDNFLQLAASSPATTTTDINDELKDFILDILTIKSIQGNHVISIVDTIGEVDNYEELSATILNPDSIGENFRQPVKKSSINSSFSQYYTGLTQNQDCLLPSIAVGQLKQFLSQRNIDFVIVLGLMTNKLLMENNLNLPILPIRLPNVEQLGKLSMFFDNPTRRRFFSPCTSYHHSQILLLQNDSNSSQYCFGPKCSTTNTTLTSALILQARTKEKLTIDQLTYQYQNVNHSLIKSTPIQKNTDDLRTPEN